MKHGHTTRFNPTTNGALHLGHVYIALFNHYEAHSNGDKYYVRFEDNQPEWVNIYGKQQSRDFGTQMADSLEWLGIHADDYAFQSDMEEQALDFARLKQYPVPRYTWPHPAPLDPTKLQNLPPMIGDWYSYTPYFTYMKVIYDYLQGCSAIIRGDDLRSEFTLYLHYCDALELERPMHYYMPRLRQNDGGGLAKHKGARSIDDYRHAGANPEDILNLLAISSLQNPDAGWFLGNVKKEPRLVEAFAKLG